MADIEVDFDVNNTWKCDKCERKIHEKEVYLTVNGIMICLNCLYKLTSEIEEKQADIRWNE